MPVQKSHGKHYPFAPVEGELPQPNAGAAGAAPLADGRDGKGRLRSSAAASALAKLPRRSKYLPRTYACDPRFEPFNRSRVEWLAKRRGEVCDATGAVSHGVGAMLNAAAWSYAAGEFLSALAAERGDPELFKQAASLTTTARGHDRMAWELAVLEGQTRPRVDRIAQLQAELSSGGGDHGEG